MVVHLLRVMWRARPGSTVGDVGLRELGVFVSDGTGLTEEQVWVSAVALVAVTVTVGAVVTIVRAADLLFDLGLGALTPGHSK